MLIYVYRLSGKDAMSVNSAEAKYHKFENRWCECDYMMIIVPQGLSQDDLLKHLKETHFKT